MDNSQQYQYALPYNQGNVTNPYPPTPTNTQINPPTPTNQLPYQQPYSPSGFQPTKRIEESYIENIIRLNRGKLGTFYMTYSDSNEWRDRVYKGVIEAAGGNNTFEFAWKIARPNATVFVVAMYEQAQVLPLEKMYGKNLTFKTGGVDAIYCDKLLQLISENKISTDFLISKTFAFSDIEKAYEEFQQKHIYKIALKF